MNVLSLFDGMSCGQIALERAGFKVDNYFAAEINQKSIQITQANYPNTIQVGDVTKLRGIDLPKIDLLIGGSPCQSFSSFGNGTGMEGKSGLFWEYVRILKETQPKYFLLENVVMKKEWEDIITEALGVKPIKINSALVSAQNRPRLYWTNIEGVKQPKDLGLFVYDILDDNAEFTDNYPKYLLGKFGNKTRLEHLWFADGKASCLTATMWKGQKSTFTRNRNNKIHRFSVAECERLQTLPTDYTKVKGISNTARYQAIGDGWNVDTIVCIISCLNGCDSRQSA